MQTKHGAGRVEHRGNCEEEQFVRPRDFLKLESASQCSDRIL